MTDTLMDTADVQPQDTGAIEQTENGAVDTALQPSLWYFDDGIPGAGDKPDYLLPKFKTMVVISSSAVATSSLPDSFIALPGASLHHFRPGGINADCKLEANLNTEIHAVESNVL